MKHTSLRRISAALPTAVIFGILFLTAAEAQATPGFSHWWLPADYSTHGHAIDSLFVWIFWITTIVFIAVQLVLIVFLIRYRSRPGKKKAVYTHGNTKLEMCWTLAPAVILAAIALFSKKVWDDYRYSDMANAKNLAKVLVIGQQFKWNVVYPGPDGKIGKYLKYPKPTDLKWPLNDEGKEQMLEGVAGPAFLPYDKSVKAINNYVEAENKLGKDFSDENGKDDDWSKSAGRPIILPANTPIQVQLSSRDVIHDFFLPNYRVKLDAVPGMRGLLHFQSNKQSTESHSIDDSSIIGKTIWLDSETKGAQYVSRYGDFAIPDPKNRRIPIVTNLKPITAEMVQKMKAIGVTHVYTAQSFELVCEELCGGQHNTMQGIIYFVSPSQYNTFMNKKNTAAAQAEQKNDAAASVN